jgi:hypothetical protein
MNPGVSTGQFRRMIGRADHPENGTASGASVPRDA